jgi:hypothetical protein
MSSYSKKALFDIRWYNIPSFPSNFASCFSSASTQGESVIEISGSIPFALDLLVVLFKTIIYYCKVTLRIILNDKEPCTLLSEYTKRVSSSSNLSGLVSLLP